MHDRHHIRHHQAFDLHAITQRVDVCIAGGQGAIDYYAAMGCEACCASKQGARFEADGG